MTEAEWLACEDPQAMLNNLGGRWNERLFRLFACACCHLATSKSNEQVRAAIAVAERYADERATYQELDAARRACDAAFPSGSENPSLQGAEPDLPPRDAVTLACAGSTVLVLRFGQVYPFGGTLPRAVRATQCRLARCIFGNPFRTVAIDTSWLRWNGDTIPKLAQAIYDDRRFPDLPILADALEEAGCTDEAILAHCRQPGEHVRGCWVVDALLGKE